MTYRDSVIDYAHKKYKTRPEYLWARWPRYAVLRRGDNKKWYGVIMNVARGRLGMTGDDDVDILNVRVPAGLYDVLRGGNGFLRGYHMGGMWVSVLLDGTVELSQICALLDTSYETVKKKTAQ